MLFSFRHSRLILVIRSKRIVKIVDGRSDQQALLARSQTRCALPPFFSFLPAGVRQGVAKRARYVIVNYSLLAVAFSLAGKAKAKEGGPLFYGRYICCLIQNRSNCGQLSGLGSSSGSALAGLIVTVITRHDKLTQQEK